MIPKKLASQRNISLTASFNEEQLSLSDNLTPMSCDKMKNFSDPLNFVIKSLDKNKFVKDMDEFMSVEFKAKVMIANTN